MISVIPRKKVLISRHSELKSSERNRTERNSAKKWSFTELALHGLYDYSDIEHYYWNFGLPSFVLSRFFFRGMVRNGILTVCFYIFSTERNSELFSLSLKDRKGILSVCFYFCIHGKEFRVVFSSAEVFGREFRVVFSSAEGFGTEFRGFLFRGTAWIPSEITICSVYSVFRGIIFLSEIPNPTSVPTSRCFQCLQKNFFAHFLWFGGGGHTRLRERGWGGTQF